MRQRQHKSDKLYCGKCRTRLLEEMIPAGSLVPYSGVVGMYCVKCDETTPVWSRRIQQVPPMVSVQAGATVRDRCVICSRAIATVIRRGAGERVIYCENHTNEEKARWQLQHQGKCITPDCKEKATSRGRCGRCYSRWWREQAKADTLALRRMSENDKG